MAEYRNDRDLIVSLIGNSFQPNDLALLALGLKTHYLEQMFDSNKNVEFRFKKSKEYRLENSILKNESSAIQTALNENKEYVLILVNTIPTKLFMDSVKDFDNRFMIMIFAPNKMENAVKRLQLYYPTVSIDDSIERDKHALLYFFINENHLAHDVLDVFLYDDEKNPIGDDFALMDMIFEDSAVIYSNDEEAVKQVTGIFEATADYD